MIKDLGSYIVHSSGTIYSKKLGRLIKPWNMKGYVQVKLDGKMTTVHRLIAKIFIPNPKNKPEVNHKNGIKDDNRIRNLEWSTHSENIQHAYNNGMIGKRLGLHWKKFEKYDFDMMKERRKAGVPCSEICKEFKISKGYLSRVINGHVK